MKSCLSSAVPFLGAVFAFLTMPATAQALTINVFLIGGQSNADGRANVTGSTQPLPTALANTQTDVPIYYGTSPSKTSSNYSYSFANSGTLTALKPGLSYTTSTAKFGPEVSFGRSMADYYEAKGESIALIKYAAGGTSLAVDWKAGGTATTSGDGGSYLNFQSIVTSGLAALQAANPSATIVVSGMIWMQGESDSNAFSTQYQMNLTNFISDIRLTYGANLPFVIGQLSTSQTGTNSDAGGTTADRNAVRAAQAAVAAANPLNRLVVTDSFAMSDDNLHFNRPGQVDLGYAFATQMQSLVVVPEPATWGVVFFSLGAVAVRYRRSRRRAA